MEALILPFSTLSILCGSLSQAFARSACVHPFFMRAFTICAPINFNNASLSTVQYFGLPFEKPSTDTLILTKTHIFV